MGEGGRHPRSAREEALRRFVDMLLRWNRSINLVGRRDVQALWTRHVADSLQLGSVFGPLPARAIDLGSGAGFPGLVLAIRYGITVDLIEEDQRKAAFLREAARITGAPARVHAVKIEAAAVDPAPLVTARGLASVSRLLAYAERLLAPDGACVFPKTRHVEAELEEAARDWTMRVERRPSLTDVNGVVLRLSEIRRRGG